MIYLVYKTDAWHTTDSKELIACCDTKKKAIRLIKQIADKDDNEKLSEDDIYNLEHINQTQGYAGSGEFLIEEIEKNVLPVW
jgi:hypothetical protein